MLEFEVRLAAAALGLDPGLGILRVGAQARDSLACDLMESCSATSRRILVGLDYPPALEARMVLRREERELPTHGPIREAPLGDDSHWARAVAPVAEWVVQAFWNSSNIQRTRRKAFRQVTEAKVGESSLQCS
jgi:hypothetical protein